MAKVSVGKNVFIPMPVCLVGANVCGKANFMTVGFITRVSINPAYIGIGIGKIHFTTEGIKENKTFSVNFPATSNVAVSDYCGIVSGEKEDKSKLFDVFYGTLKSAPMIDNFPLSLECQLVDTHEYGTHNFFVGEIVASHADETCLSEGKLDFAKISPFILTMMDNNYWQLGKQIGKAFAVGKEIKDR